MCLPQRLLDFMINNIEQITKEALDDPKKILQALEDVGELDDALNYISIFAETRVTKLLDKAPQLRLGMCPSKESDTIALIKNAYLRDTLFSLYRALLTHEDTYIPLYAGGSTGNNTITALIGDNSKILWTIKPCDLPWPGCNVVVNVCDVKKDIQQTYRAHNAYRVMYLTSKALFESGETGEDG